MAQLEEHEQETETKPTLDASNPFASAVPVVAKTNPFASARPEEPKAQREPNAESEPAPEPGVGPKVEETPIPRAPPPSTPVVVVMKQKEELGPARPHPEAFYSDLQPFTFVDKRGTVSHPFGRADHFKVRTCC